MPDFTADFTGGASVVVWQDPALGSQPSRINPSPEHPHRRHVGSTGVQVEITATVLGVVGEVDANLGGRLFIGELAESASAPKPAVSSPAGQSSVQRFTPTAPGHYTFVLRRESGGGIFHHIDIT